MNKDRIIYKQFHKYIPLDKMKDLQWFALTKNYGEVYGDINCSYKFKKEPKLLDIGNADIRKMIKNTIYPENDKIEEYSDPNYQYSGNSENKKYHNLVKEYFGDEYDGTIISEDNLQGNIEYHVTELEGPSEIVIWKDHNSLLEEIKEGGYIKSKTKGIKRNKLTKSKIKRNKLTKSKKNNKTKRSVKIV